MRLIKELAFTAALTLASLASITTSYAHEIKLGDLVIGHPWSRQSPMAADWWVLKWGRKRSPWRRAVAAMRAMLVRARAGSRIRVGLTTVA